MLHPSSGGDGREIIPRINENLKLPAVAVLFIVLQMEYFFIGGKGALSIDIQRGIACDASLLGCLPELPGMAAVTSSMFLGEKRAQERRKSRCALQPAGNMSLSLNPFPKIASRPLNQPIGELQHMDALGPCCWGVPRTHVANKERIRMFCWIT